MSDLIHANDLMARLHSTEFKDGDDRSIVYAIIAELQEKPLKDQMIDKYEEEIAELRGKLNEAIAAAEHNRKVAEKNQDDLIKARLQGEVDGLKFALRCNGVSGWDDRA